jgi:hypothetical protein
MRDDFEVLLLVHRVELAFWVRGDSSKRACGERGPSLDGG